MWTFINAHVRGYEGIDPRADLVVDLEKNLHEQFAQFAQECLNSNIPEEEAVKSFTDYLGKSHLKQWNEAMVLVSYTPCSGALIDVVLQQFHTLVTNQRQPPTPTPSPAPTPAFFGGAVGAGCFICGSRHTWRRCWYKESHRSKANAADKFCHIHGGLLILLCGWLDINWLLVYACYNDAIPFPIPTTNDSLAKYPTDPHCPYKFPH